MNLWLKLKGSTKDEQKSDHRNVHLMDGAHLFSSDDSYLSVLGHMGLLHPIYLCRDIKKVFT